MNSTTEQIIDESKRQQIHGRLFGKLVNAAIIYAIRNGDFFEATKSLLSRALEYGDSGLKCLVIKHPDFQPSDQEIESIFKGRREPLEELFRSGKPIPQKMINDAFGTFINPDWWSDEPYISTVVSLSIIHRPEMLSFWHMEMCIPQLANLEHASFGCMRKWFRNSEYDFDKAEKLCKFHPDLLADIMSGRSNSEVRKLRAKCDDKNATIKRHGL